MRKRAAAIAVGLLVMLVAGCAAHPLPKGPVEPEFFTEAKPAEPFLGPLDRVRIEVFGHPEFSTNPSGVDVAPDGTVPCARLGPVPVTGRTIEQVREDVLRQVQRFLKTPVVNAEVMTWKSRAIYVFGAVEGGGQFFLDRPLTALQALALGGKFRDGADRCNVVLLRQKDERMAVWIFNAVTPDDRAHVAIRSGDILFVRLSGTGRFSEQIMPYIQSFSTLAGAASAMRNTGTWWENSGG